MPEIEHFAYGVLTPILAYAMSFIGSLLGLQCTARARFATGRSRVGWLLLAAVSIGGTGVWVMHFIAMLGFQVTGMDIRYGVNLTLLSALIAIVVVGIGIFIVGYGGSRPVALIGGGLVTGLGVASMHYMGMGAMNMSGRVDYDLAIVGASILIAVVAATVALWFTIRVKGHWVTAGAALVMGVAVSGMHYTGMAAMQVVDDTAVGTPSGASAFDFLLPLVIGISIFAMLLLVTIGLSLTEDEMQLERQFEQQLRDRALQRETGGDFIPTAPGQRSWTSR
ncbi:MAG: hypothetical protein M3446_02665 [Actinomycetota bacterium]|nr:hypothetical protein [Actinomycetota bacterium]